MTIDSHIDHVDWPAELSSYAQGDRLRFATKGPHPFVWIAVPFALALGALGAAGIVGLGAPGLVSIIVGIAATAFAVGVLTSAAYGIWGVQEIERRGGDWIVTRRLGSLRSVSTLPAVHIRSAEVSSPPPFVVIWPGSAGRHVRVHVSGRERPIEVAAGLQLDNATLQALQLLFTPNP
jgi:hypothetical protein